MPKDRRVFDRSMVSPYSCSSKISDRKNSKSSLPHVGDKKEWEEVRCPICMEHPHNAVLLLCSSHEKGCRPFICDTSYRHSNCFDQFRKSSAAASLHALSEKQQSELVCPLCRGTVTGWDVIHLTREFLNSKTRSCSLETCNFTGNYAELRKHARLEHPSRRPSEASPNRQKDWIMLEEQRDVEDALVYQSDIDYNLNVLHDWEGLPADDIWDGENPFLLDEWVGDDIWTGGSLFDFPSGMSDVEDDLSTLSGLSIPLFSPYASAHYDDVLNSVNSVSGDVDMMDSGNSRSEDQPQWAIVSGSRLDFHLGDAAPGSGSGPSYHHSEDGANVDDASVSRSRSSFQRETNSLNSRSRSGHHRGNGRTSSSNRSSYHRGDNQVGLRARSYSRVNDSNASRSSYSRANHSNISRSRSRYYWENSSASSRRSSSYHGETEQHNSRSRLRSRFNRSRDFVPPVRELGRRSFSSSSRHDTWSSRRLRM